MLLIILLVYKAVYNSIFRLSDAARHSPVTKNHLPRDGWPSSGPPESDLGDFEPGQALAMPVDLLDAFLSLVADGGDLVSLHFLL